MHSWPRAHRCSAAGPQLVPPWPRCSIGSAPVAPWSGPSASSSRGSSTQSASPTGRGDRTCQRTQRGSLGSDTRSTPITADQTEKLPERSRKLIREAVDEYETRETLEARCAKDANKLEMLLQTVEYPRR